MPERDLRGLDPDRVLERDLFLGGGDLEDIRPRDPDLRGGDLDRDLCGGLDPDLFDLERERWRDLDLDMRGGGLLDLYLERDGDLDLRLGLDLRSGRDGVGDLDRLDELK